MNSDAPRPRTVVYVRRADRRWHVFVRYPGASPVLLLSAPDRDEAIRAARWYSARYGWTFEQE